MFTLVLGGVRSGKSDLARRLAVASGRDVLFVATMEPGDDEVRARIAVHRAGRPHSWRTAEAPRDLLPALEAGARPGGFVVIDCLTLWVSNLLIERLPQAGAAPVSETARAIDEIGSRAEALIAWLAAHDGDSAVVSNEVGLGVVPAHPLGRAFRDALGVANRIAAGGAGRVYFTVAGLALELKSLGAVPIDALDAAPDA